MILVARASARLWSFGLLAVFLGITVAQASDQATTKHQAVRKDSPRQLFAAAAGQRVGFVPKHMKSASLTSALSDVEIVDGGTYYEDASTGDLVISEDAMGGSCSADGLCTDGCCTECALVPCGTLPVGNLQLSFGVQGFTGPANHQLMGANPQVLSGSGSFGFYESLNWAMPIPGFQCLGGQVGFRATHSNLSGAEFTNDTRNQAFVTAGLFRRVDYGLQCGVVIDYLSDAWYRDADLLNVRGEMSWVTGGTRDIGFWFSSGTKVASEPSVLGPLENWESTDLYAFFYRQTYGASLDCEARIFAGWSGQSDGLIGGDLRVPLTDTLALETSCSYLIPQQGVGQGVNAGHAQESWNLGIGFVWYPGRRWGHDNPYYRPLFPVAHNGLFMIDRQ